MRYTFWQVSIMFYMSIGLVCHVMVLPLLLGVARRDSLAAAGCAFVVLALFTFWLIRVVRQLNGQPLFNWLEEHYSLYVSRFYRVVFIVFIVWLIFITLFDTVIFTRTAFLPHIPQFIISALLLLTSARFIKWGTRSVVGAASVLVVFVVVFGFFVAASNSSYKDYHYLLPFLMESWWTIAKGMSIALGALLEVLLLVLWQADLQRRPKWWHIVLLVFMYSSLMLGPLTAAIVEFGPEHAAQLRFPAHEQWRLLQVSTYIEHTDFLSIFQWLSGAYVRLGLLWLSLLKCFSLPRKEQRLFLSALFCLLIWLCSDSILTDFQFFHLLKQGMSVSALFSFLCLFSLYQLIRRKRHVPTPLCETAGCHSTMADK